MRLIDVDKLPVTCNVIIVDGQIELTGWIAAERITEAPTVEAIPINYIEKWIDARARIIKINPPAFRELLATKLLDDWLAGRDPDWPIKFEVE